MQDIKHGTTSFAEEYELLNTVKSTEYIHDTSQLQIYLMKNKRRNIFDELNY